MVAYGDFRFQDGEWKGIWRHDVFEMEAQRNLG